MSTTPNQDRLAKLTGISKPVQDEIFKQVKENQRKLNECAGPHEFTVDATPDKPLFKKYQCAKCGGVVQWSDKKWYETGLEHATKSNAPSATI